MTLSISARCPNTGMFGIAIASSSIAVAARCAWARAGVGVVASQNVTDPRLGRAGLDALAQGLPAPAVRDRLVRGNAFAAFRQLALVDAQGRTAHYSGAGALGRHAAAAGAGCVAIGNLLANETVPQAMVDAFANAPAMPFSERLLVALEAGEAAGGEATPVRSAGLLVVDAQEWPWADLRVDWHDRPIAELRALWALYAPQAADYIKRALEPGEAPPFEAEGKS